MSQGREQGEAEYVGHLSPVQTLYTAIPIEVDATKESAKTIPWFF